MAIIIACPSCTHRQSYEDSQAGKQVHCKICHHLLTLKASTPPPLPRPRTASHVKAGAPAVKGANARPVDDEDEGPRPRRRVDDEDEDDRPARRSRRDEGDSTVLIWSLVAGGGVLLVGVIGLVALLLFLWPAGNEVPPVAQAPPPPPVVPPPMPQPPVIQVPFPRIQMPDFAPPPNLNPPRERLDPKDPAQLDKALAALAQPGGEPTEAINWFLHASPDHPRRAEAAAALEKQVDDQLRRPFADNFFRAFFRWATKENYPTLLRFVENAQFTVWDNQRRAGAMEALGKLKDERAAPAIAGKLESIFDRRPAVTALTEMGPAAEPAVLKYLHHPDRGVRDEARQLLKRYGTKDDALLGQTITDLGAAEDGRQKSAVAWLADAPVDEARKADVSKALTNHPIDARSSFHQEPMIKALEKWGTAENVPQLVQLLEGSRVGNQAVVRLLGKLKDPRGIQALAARLGNFFDGPAAGKALREIGKDAEPAVIGQLPSADRKTRVAACHLLADIGTKQVSLPALTAAVRQYPQDRDLLAAAQAAGIAINRRP